MRKIFHRFRDRSPFAICIDTIHFADNECQDIFAVTPKDGPKEMVHKFEGYDSMVTHDLTEKERQWFAKNRHEFKEVMRNHEGIVYEPNYCNFREVMKKWQISIF